MQRAEEARLRGRFQVVIAVHRLTPDIKHDRDCQPAQIISEILKKNMLLTVKSLYALTGVCGESC